jgi:HEAT repeat protein
MHDLIQSHRRLRLSFILALTLLAWAGRVGVHAQPAVDDPVEELRQALKSCTRDPESRDRMLSAIVPLVQDIGDLRRALTLREWRDQDLEEKWAAIDRPHRARLARQFGLAVRDVFQHGDETARLAVLKLLGDPSANSGGIGPNFGIVREFAPDLVALSHKSNTCIRVAALRVLAQVDPEPTVAASAFGDVLSSESVAERIAAAEALASWMRTVSDLAARSADPTGVLVTRSRLANVGGAIVPLAGKALQDANPRVRRAGLQAIGRAAEALSKIVTATRMPEGVESIEEIDQQIERERQELLPLIAALKNQGAALTRALTDPDADVLVLARRALEDMTNPQLRLLERAARVAREKNNGTESPPAVPFILTSSPAHDSLVQGLQGTVLTLATGLASKDVRARRAAIEILENLGPAAAPAAKTLVGSLADSDPFVRWAAARALGKIAPIAAETAVPALAKLLQDGDLDLRLAAAGALERYGPAAKTAVIALIESVKSTETELRVASIRTLGAIGGPEACRAVPILAASMADPEPRVRQLAASALGKLGSAASAAEQALRRALEDKDPDVQKAAGEALLKIRRPHRTQIERLDSPDVH